VANLNASLLNGATFAAPGPIGSGTPGTGAFTTLSASSTVSGAGFSTYLASPPAIGGTTPSTGKFTTVQSTIATGTAPLTVASTTNVPNLNASSLNGATFAAPGPIGSTTPGTGAFTTLSASSTVSGAGFSTYLASPPTIGGTTPGLGNFATPLNVGGNAIATGVSVVVNSAVNQFRSVLFQTAGVNRWTFQAINGAESGGNVGTDFAINRFDDAGVSLGPNFTMSRASGRVTMNAGVAISGGAASTIDGAVVGGTTPAAVTATQLNVTTAAGPNMRAGTGAATGTQPKGSIWLRTDGAVGTTVYVSQGAGTWNPVAGV
jgi:hypothetical protein